MKRVFKLLAAIITFINIGCVSLMAAVPKGSAIVIVADSRKFTGVRAWWTNLYNESHLAFAILTIVIIPTVGLLLGKITGYLMAGLGINLKSRDLAEH